MSKIVYHIPISFGVDLIEIIAPMAKQAIANHIDHSQRNLQKNANQAKGQSSPDLLERTRVVTRTKHEVPSIEPLFMVLE